MKTLIQTLFFFLLVTQICLAQLQLNRSHSQSECPSINLFNSSVDIDSFITATMDTFHIPGLSACIVRDGEIIWKDAYGYADIDNNRQVTNSTLFKLASVSKPFTGTALMQLMENSSSKMDSLKQISSLTRQAYNLAAQKYHDLFHNEMNEKEYDRKLLDSFAARFNNDSLICDAGCGP